jgi:hypothetical protein
MLQAILVLSFVGSSFSTRLTPTRKELTSLLKSKGPAGVPADFECAWRSLAFDYAKIIQPQMTSSQQQDVFNGLELGSLCNQTNNISPATVSVSSTSDDEARARISDAATAVYVDAVNGNDSNSGSESSPFKTISFAVSFVRSAPKPATVVLRGNGVHRLTSTLQLTEADNFLSIVNYPGDASPVISSGMVLSTSWQPVTSDDADTDKIDNKLAVQSKEQACAGTWQTYPNVDAMYGDFPDPNVINASATSSYTDCQTTCQNYNGCKAWIYYNAAGNFGQQWDGMCFLRTDNRFSTTAQDNTFSGRCYTPPPPPNKYVTDLGAAGTPLPASVMADDAVITLLFSADGGRSTQRAFRARFPNADLELDMYPTGWQGGAARITPPVDMNTTVYHTPLPDNYGPGMFSDYYFGQGGPCDRFEDGEWNSAYGPSTISYWCQPNGRVAGNTYFVRSPVGFNVTTSQLPNGPYASDITKSGTTLHYWRNGHWFSMMVKIAAASTDANNKTTLTFGRGAFQGAEGDETGEDWYIDHVLEELDAPKEFYFDYSTQRLFYVHNATKGTPIPPTWTFEVPMLKCLINITGSSTTSLATNISISGITFTSAAASYMSAHGIPSGGDWGLSRMGAILIENAQSVSVSSSLFTRLDGNAIFLSGYVRDTVIDLNEFVWIGESGVASWGKTNGVDATAETQPFGTIMSRNLCHEISLYEKQTSCYFQAASGNSTVSYNIFYNMARAAVNHNDDMYGGGNMTRNLIWNTCRESQDHGPFNSWGRVPYLVNWPNGTVSQGIKPFFDDISRNFIVAGGGANGGSLDNDDGSSFYHDHDSFYVYGGHKSDFDGKAKVSYNNVMAFANVYGSHCVEIMNLPHQSPNPFFAEGYYNNICILAAAGDNYLDMGSCKADPTFLQNSMILGNNTVYVPGSSATVSCGKSYTIQEWIATGLDPGTTVMDLPSTAEIIQMAKTVLQM